MWCEVLCSGCEEELVVSAAEDASGVRIDLDVYHLRVVGAADVNEGMKLYADWALKCCEHGVCNRVIEGDYILCGVGCGVSFLVGYDVRAFWGRAESEGGKREVIIAALDGGEEHFLASNWNSSLVVLHVPDELLELKRKKWVVIVNPC